MQVVVEGNERLYPMAPVQPIPVGAEHAGQAEPAGQDRPDGRDGKAPR
jgi:hypothetical protein